MLRPIVIAAFLVTGLTQLISTMEAVAKPPKARAARGAGAKATKDLQHAYDRLRDVSLYLIADKAKPLPQTAELYDSATELYRSAHRALVDGDRERAGELAKAAHDAARGLKHSFQAPAVAGLPTPPVDRGGSVDRWIAGQETWQEAREQLERAFNRIQETEAGAPADSPSRQFVEASRRVYTFGRRAYEDGDYPRAVELARAAEAWTHVREHILRSTNQVAQLSRRPLPPPPRPDDRPPARRPGGVEPPPPALN